MSLYSVVAGGYTLSGDLNQYFNQFTGVTGGSITLLAASSNNFTIENFLPSAPGAGNNQVLVQCRISGDNYPRAAFIIHGADGTAGAGYGGVIAGNGGSGSSYFYGVAGGGWQAEGNFNINGVRVGDDGSGYSYFDGVRTLSFRVGGTHAFVAQTSNSFVYGGSNYGFLTAGAAQFNITSTYADIAEHLLTTPAVVKGMAVCTVDNDTVGPCTHDACRRAKIVSTAPALALSARMKGLDDLTPQEGHESAKPIVIGGVAPVLVDGPIKRGDLVTSAGAKRPGYLRVATDAEYALGDVVAVLPDGTVNAWIHY